LSSSDCFFEGVGRDFAPAGESLSFASPKESDQRKGDPTVCVPPLRYGQPAVLGYGGGPQNSLHFVALRQLRPLSRLRLRSSAQPEGSGSGHRCARPRMPFGPSLRSAWVAEDPRPARHPTPHKDAPWRVDSDPLWLRRGAQRFADKGSQLFERSEFCETPRNASTAGCPVAKRRGRRQWGRLFFAYFLLAKQKKVGRPPGRDPANSLPQGAGLLEARRTR
jgi:hypothetical protein